MPTLIRLQALLFLAAIGYQATLSSAQELDELRSEVRTERVRAPVVVKSAPKNHEKRQADKAAFASTSLSNSTTSCDDDGTLSEYFGGALVAGLSSPFWAPRAVVGDTTLEPGFFLRYPYLHDQDGALAEYRFSEEVSRTWLLRARSEYADDFDSLSKIGGAVLLEHAFRWGIDSEFNYRREELAWQYDHLWTGDANLVYRFAQSEQLQMRTGVGCNWLTDSIGTDLGFNFTYGGDWFPTKPLIISHEIDWGKVGHATLFHGRVTAGVNYHRLELYTGYDYFDVGKSQVSGLVGGVRLWISR